MQDNMFVSHTFCGGHGQVNSYAYKPVEMCFITYLATNTHVTPIFKGYFLKTFSAPFDLSTLHPQ